MKCASGIVFTRAWIVAISCLVVASDAAANDFPNPDFNSGLDEWRRDGEGVTLGEEPQTPERPANKFAIIGPGAEPTLLGDFACGDPDPAKRCRIRFQYKFTQAAGENEVLTVFDSGGNSKGTLAPAADWTNKEVQFDDCGPQTISLQLSDPDGDEEAEESTASADRFSCECIAAGGGGDAPPKKKTCAGCRVAGGGPDWVIALAVLVLLLRRR